MPFFQRLFLNNTLLAWTQALALFALAWGLLVATKGIVRHRLAKFAQHTETKVDDLVVEVLGGTHLLTLLLLSLYAGSRILTLPMSVEHVIHKVLVLSLLAQGTLWTTRAISVCLHQMVQDRKDEDAARATALGVIGFASKAAAWVIFLLLALDNLGVNVTGLVAGLGIGGIAVALALQNILGDLFASLSIVLDRPFVIGDFLIVGEHLGTVEHVGLKTTRIRSLSAELLILSNADLLKSRIRNFKQMAERRVVFTIGVTYQTSQAQLAAIPGMIQDVIEAQPTVRFDRAHFREFGESALVFEVVYFVLDPDYTLYMDLQQAICMELFRRFEAEAIAFAYPTQTLFLARETHPGWSHVRLAEA